MPSRAVPRWRPWGSRSGPPRRSPWAESERDGHGPSNHPGKHRQGEGPPRTLARRPRGGPRMGELPRPRGGADVAVRRHLPREPLDVHLRPRLPGRAHRTGPRVGPGMLLLRGPLHQRQGRPPGRGGGGHADTRAVAVPRQGPTQARDASQRRAQVEVRRAHHPAGERRLHLPQPSGLPRRRGVRLAPRRHRARRPAPRAQARRVLAAAAAPRRRGGRRRARDLGHPAVGPSRLGRGRLRVPLVVHRVTRGLRGDPPGLQGARARDRRHGGQEDLQAAGAVPRGARRGAG